MVKLANDKGSIHISTDVFTWLAGDAATRCFGVKGMAGLSKESGLVQLLRRESMTKGVSVRPLDDNGIAIDLHIVVDHGVNLNAVGEAIIERVSYEVTNCTGTAVRAVNVYIDSMMID